MSNPKPNLPAKVEQPADPAAALQKLLDDFGPGALAKMDEIGRAFKLAEGAGLTPRLQYLTPIPF